MHLVIHLFWQTLRANLKISHPHAFRLHPHTSPRHEIRAYALACVIEASDRTFPLSLAPNALVAVNYVPSFFEKPKLERTTSSTPRCFSFAHLARLDCMLS